MTKTEETPSRSRRSKRISQKIRDADDDWYSLDSIATYSSSTETKRDELTGRGVVHYIDDITAIEFETLEDMKLYDSVAEKIGNVCCASFNEFSLPLRGFSDEECSSSNNYYLRFKALKDTKFSHLQSVVISEHTCVDKGYDIPGVNRGSNNKVPKSIKKSTLKCVKMKLEVGSSTCEPHGKQSCAPCSAAAKSRNPKLNEVLNSLPTPAVSPDTKYYNLIVPSRNCGLDLNIDEDLLTPVGSPASVDDLDRPSKTPPMSEPLDSKPIDFSSIPYIFKCSAPHECHSSKACADSSSNFRLCIKLTPGKGRAMSRFAIMYLDQRKDSDTVNRVSATIAASAVDSSAGSIFLPFNKNLISSWFPPSNLIQSLASLVPHTHLETMLKGTSRPPITVDELSENDDVEESETLIDPKLLKSLKSNEQKLCGYSSDPCNNAVSPNSSDTNEVYKLPTGDKRYNDPDVTPCQTKKRLLGSFPNSGYERSNKPALPDLHHSFSNSDLEIEGGECISDSESLHDIDTPNTEELDDPLSSDYQKKPSDDETVLRSQMQNFNQGTMLHPSPTSKCLVQSGSIEVSDSLLPKKDEPVQELLRLEQHKITMSTVYGPSVKRFKHSYSIENPVPSTSDVDSTFVGNLEGGLQLQLNTGHMDAPQPELLSSMSKDEQPPLDGSSARTVTVRENTPDSKPCSSGEFCPRIVYTASLSCKPVARSDAFHVEQREYEKRNSASQYSPYHSDLRTAVNPENSSSKLEGVIDLTAGENHSTPHQASTVKHYETPKKRKRLSSSSSQLPEKVIVIDDDYHETENEVILTKKISKSGGLVSGSSSKLDSPVTIPAIHVQKVNSILNSNEKIIDLTEGSGYDETWHNRQSGLAAQHPALNLKLAFNSKEKVIDLTDGNEGQSLLERSVEDSAKLDNASNKNEICSERRKMPTKLVVPPNHAEVLQHLVKNKSVSPNGIQELAVMCPTVPTLGYIKVIRLSTGEMILNETFTARVYKHFDDLKELNSYLNLRFEKMLGVKGRGPLNWILATAGVVKLKKVRPINPKVWFRPTDYILKEHGPDNVLTVLSLNSPKTRYFTSKKTRMSCSPKLVSLTQGETRNMLLRNPLSLPEDGRPSPVSKCNSAFLTDLTDDSDKLRTARFVSVLLDKQHSMQQSPTSSLNKDSSFNNKANTDQPVVLRPSSKIIKTNKVISSNLQHSKQSSLLKNEVSQPGVQMSADVCSSTQNKPVTTQRMAVLFDKHPNRSHNLVCVTHPAGNPVNDATQFTNRVASSIVQNSIHSKSVMSQNTGIVVASGTNQLTKHPTTNVQNDILGNAQAVVIKNNQKCSQANQTPQKNNICNPRTPQILQTFSLNKDPISVPTNSQPDLKGRICWSTIKKSNTRLPVLILPKKQFIIRSINQESPSQTGPVIVNNDSKDNMQISNQAQVGMSQNMTLLLNCQTSRASRVHQHKVSSGTLCTSNASPSVALLPNKELGQSTNQEPTNNLSSTVLEKSNIAQPVRVSLTSQTKPAINTLQYKVSFSTPNTSQSVVLLPDKECGQSSIQESSNNMPNSIPAKLSVPQPLTVLGTNQKHQSNDRTMRPILPRPRTSQILLLNNQKGQPIKAHQLCSGSVLSTPTTAHSLASVPDKQTSQPTNLGKSSATHPLRIVMSNSGNQAHQVSFGNTQTVIHNKPTTSQKVSVVPTSQVSPSHHVKFIPITSTNAQGSTVGKLAAAKSVTHVKQSPNKMVPIIKTGYTDAMIYFSSEGKNIKGIPAQKFPVIVNKTNSGSPKPTEPYNSSDIISPSNKPVEFIRKSSHPKMLYSTLDKSQDNIHPAPLNLHWATLLRKPS